MVLLLLGVGYQEFLNDVLGYNGIDTINAPVSRFQCYHCPYKVAPTSLAFLDDFDYNNATI